MHLFPFSNSVSRPSAFAEIVDRIPADAEIMYVSNRTAYCAVIEPIHSITHGPPHRILDRTNMGVPAGCEALAPRLEQLRPALCVFGHIHEARGAVIREWEDDGSGRRKRTVYVNAATQAGRRDRDKDVSCFESFLDIDGLLILLPLVLVQKTGW